MSKNSPPSWKNPLLNFIPPKADRSWPGTQHLEQMYFGNHKNGLDINPLLPFAHGLAPPLFAPPSRKDPGSVDLSISSRNSPSFNSGQISPANLVIEKINRSPAASASPKSLIRSPSSSFGKITPVDPALLMDNAKSHLEETPSKESPSKKAKSTTPSPIQTSTPKVDITPPAEPTKSRRKRKQNVTKRMTNDDCLMDDLRTDYSETAMDIESDLSAERINESPINLQNLKNPEKQISTTPIPTVQPPIPVQDSDDCETIDKIAEMVSDMTSKNDLSNSLEDPSAEKSAHQIMEEVENRLEEMFADPNEPIPSTSKAANEEDSKKEQLESSEVGPAAKKKKVRAKKETTKAKKPPVNGKAAKEPKNGKKGKNSVANGANKKDSKMNGTSKSDKKFDKKVNGKEKTSKSKQKNEQAGPILQLLKDGSFNIVNQSTNGDDDNEKAQNKLKKTMNNHNADRHKIRGRGLHVSTLSNKYDADTKDVTWVCVFCKLGPHKHELGDLFGPYIVSTDSEEYKTCQQDLKTDPFSNKIGNKNKLSKHKQIQMQLLNPQLVIEAQKEGGSPKKKRKLMSPVPGTSSDPDVNSSNYLDLFSGMSQIDEKHYEVWVHEDCIIWASGVYIIGTKVVGLEAAIWSSTRHTCYLCLKRGAMVTCIHRGCNRESHLYCGRTNKWKFDEEFKTHCDSHVLL